MAARQGHSSVVEYLCTHTSLDHINNKTDHLGLTAIGEACKLGHARSLEILLLHGADVMVRRHNGQTPLHQAAAAGHVECVRLCCEAGAEPLAVDNNAQTAADVAATMLADEPELKAAVLGELLRISGHSYPKAPIPWSGSKSSNV